MPRVGLIVKRQRVGSRSIGRGQDAVKPAEHRERRDDVLVFTPLEGVTDEVAHAPEEADDFAMVHVLALPEVMASPKGENYPMGVRATAGS